MTGPGRYLSRMLIFVVAVAALVAALFPALVHAFMANVALNASIVAVLVVGILYIFRQVLQLQPEARWLDTYRRNQPGLSVQRAPRQLAPLAAALGDRPGGRLTLSAIAARSLLDSIRARLDEGRDISRYMIGLLVFLGLLGTFWGLLETVSSIAGVIAGLGTVGGDINAFFNELKSGLQAPLGGMGTAFSSSMLGLAGSLVLGFLDLQASQAQNRFYNELEEWLAGMTKVGAGTAIGDFGEAPTSVPAFLQALIEKTADSMDNLQRTVARGEDARRGANTQLMQLTEKLSVLTDQMKAEQQLMLRLAESQMELKPVLARLADATASGLGGDEPTRAHIRNIEVYLARLVDEISNGRSQTSEEIRGEIRLLARTIAALADEQQHQGVAAQPAAVAKPRARSS